MSEQGRCVLKCCKGQIPSAIDFGPAHTGKCSAGSPSNIASCDILQELLRRANSTLYFCARVVLEERSLAWRTWMSFWDSWA